MGLDMYSFSLKNEVKEELYYWRKHNRLHGYFEQLWKEKGGQGEFNCVDLELSIEEIDNLEKVVNGMQLPETSGFFFGNDSYEYYQKENDLEFIKKAKLKIEEGCKIFYTSWW